MSYKGYKMSDESREKMRQAKLLRPNRYWLGRKRPEISKMFSGKKLTEEHKEKLRQAKLKNPVRYWLGRSRVGKVHSEEWKKVLAEKMKKESWFIGKSTRGELNPRWIKDRSKVVGRHNRNFHDSEYKQWRLNVYMRDGFKCKISDGDCDGRIEAHHILGWSLYPELRYIINNGITLCHAHHPKKRAEEKRLAPQFQELVSVSKG